MKRTLKVLPLLCLLAMVMLLMASCDQFLPPVTSETENTPATTTPPETTSAEELIPEEPEQATQCDSCMGFPCTWDGVIIEEGVWRCSACGNWVMYENEKQLHSIVIGEVAPTCTQVGFTKSEYCEACGEVFATQTEIPALGHKYSYEFTDPTQETVILTFTCEECKDSYTKEITPVDFTITSENYYKIDPNLEEKIKPGPPEVNEQWLELAIIPAFFEYENVWYRVVAIEDGAFMPIITGHVIIPSTVTIIGNSIFNWLFSCNYIEYAGTKEQWEAIVKGSKWDYCGNTAVPFEVHCHSGGFGYNGGIFGPNGAPNQ